MRQFEAQLESLSPVSWGRYYELDVPKEDKELHKDYEKRTWRNKLHTNGNGEAYIPANMLKLCISNAAQYLSIKIPGKRNQTYTKHFVAGILVLDNIPLGVKKDEVNGEWVLVPADGKRGGTTRVPKCFPTIPSWKGKLVIHVLDDIITEEILAEVLKAAGFFIGIGTYRPQCNGTNGRFKVVSLKQVS